MSNIHKLICRICRKEFSHDNPQATLCFVCATNEIIRLREQEQIIQIKLNNYPEISDLLEKLSTENILARLKAKWYFSEYNPSINPEKFQDDCKGC